MSGCLVPARMSGMSLSPADEEEGFRLQLQLLPGDARVHSQFAGFLATQGRAAEAIEQYERAISLQANPRDHQRLAALLNNERRFSDAIPHLQAALAAAPEDVRRLTDLGNTLVNARQPEEALPFLRQAVHCSPAEQATHNNLALALTDLGRFAEAEQSLFEALRWKPAHAPTYNNLGHLYIMMGRHAEAIGVLERALQYDPQHALARRNRALTHLALGDFERGWLDYDWCAPGIIQPADPAPLWHGQALAGKRLLLTARQGLGDLVQFIRYARLLKALPTPPVHVALECPLPLLKVLAGVEGIDQLIALGDPLGTFDLSVPVMALPRLLCTTVETIPAKGPYLTADPDRIAAWRQRLSPLRERGRRLVGLYWQGNPHHQWDRFRSIQLGAFEPLTRVPTIRMISLQRGPGIEQIEPFNRLTRGALHVPTDGQQTTPEHLADTAAIMMELDLVITVDTVTAHLAGALARPVWVAIAQAADWRWLTGRSDSPWYPTMRLFRQQRALDWGPVIEKITAAIANEMV